jgi:hypothetical protein
MLHSCRVKFGEPSVADLRDPERPYLVIEFAAGLEIINRFFSACVGRYIAYIEVLGIYAEEIFAGMQDEKAGVEWAVRQFPGQTVYAVG